MKQGRLEEAERLLEGNEWHPTARRLQVTIALARGDRALGEELVRLCLEGAETSDPACAPLRELQLDVQLARDDLAAARETVDRLSELAGNSERPLGRLGEARAAGRVLAAEGDERASLRLQAALESLATLDLPLEAARTRLELARALATGAPDTAVVEARIAPGAFERLGAGRDADAAAGLLRGLGAAGRVWPKRSGTLTKRETEVLSLLAAGLSNAEIAERLFISRRTAERHVANILSKLGLRSRAEAAAYAVRKPSESPVAE